MCQLHKMTRLLAGVHIVRPLRIRSPHPRMNHAGPLPPRSPLLRVLLLLLVFAPALFAGKLVWEKAVDVGCWDMWENAALLKKWHDGSLTWNDLYAPQIQHRIVVPRLMIIAMSHLSGGDFRWENYAAYLIFAANAIMLWFLLARTMGASTW